MHVTQVAGSTQLCHELKLLAAQPSSTTTRSLGGVAFKLQYTVSIPLVVLVVSATGDRIDSPNF